MTMTPLNLPRGYSVGTWRGGFVFTWVEVARVSNGNGPTVVQRAGRMSPTYPTPQAAAEAAREHASQRFS